MEVARNRNGTSGWMASGEGGKGASPLEYSIKNRNAGLGSTLDSPLAAQLQQAWLQTQLPKRDVPKLDFLNSPFPSPDYLIHQSSGSSLSPPDPFHQQQQLPSAASRSSSYSQQSPPYSVQSQPSSESFSEVYSSDGGAHDELSPISGESEPMEDDMMLQYLSDMLMEEEMVDQKCMYVQCSAYQAMTRELADLIGDQSPSQEETNPASRAVAGNLEEAERDTAVSNWIDDVLNSNPQDFFHDEHMGVSQGGARDYGDEVTSIVNGFTNCSTGSPRSTEASQKAASTPAPAPAPAPAHSAVAMLPPRVPSDLDCPYLENERTITITDYTNGRSGIESLAELYPVLMQCAQAVATDDVRGAHQLISHLRQRVSPVGDGGQRMAYYFVEALVARLSGTGAQLYTALSSNRPSAHEMLQAYRMFVQCNPLPKISHFFANATILQTVKGHGRIHIIDFGILYGVQWPCLLKKLAIREGGPPKVRITGIDFAQPGFQKNDRVEETGRRLAAKAKEIGVDFEYHAIAGKWETITAAQLNLRDDETLVVNSMFRLRNLLDETVMASSPRKMVLAKIHSLNPRLFIMGVVSAGINSPFFMARFRETIAHFSALFDAIHTCIPPDADLRRLAEKEILGREILNIISCEGTERIERAETYRQWMSRSLNAGFNQQPLDPGIIAKAGEFLKNFNSNYGIACDGHWLLTGWKERVIHGLTAWVPS